MWIVAALYRFARVEEPNVLAAQLRDVCRHSDIFGTLILAHEGINGTIAAPSSEAMETVLQVIRTHFDQLELKYSTAAQQPFKRLKIKVKPEIVTLRQKGVDPVTQVGTYVEAQAWNDLISDPEVTVIDTRNHYEVEMGTFDRAIDPRTEMFCHFPDFVQNYLDPAKHKKIAMFCTGGIRCEKASSYMLKSGFENVYHLKGGILKYLEVTPKDQSRWKGRCFVFDERESLGLGLEE